LWGLKNEDLLMGFDWKSLIEDIKTYGTRNSLLTTVMPTASTSQIMGNSEYTEPITTNIYTRTTLAGEFVIVNKYLV
jgi:ribonucleotide reductase alpha subunit